MFSELYENLNRSNDDFAPMSERVLNMLHRTWAAVSIDVCYNALRRSNESMVNPHDISRVELTVGDVRSAVYENVEMWKVEMPDVLERWMDLSVKEQDSLLVQAFPDGQVYGV